MPLAVVNVRREPFYRRDAIVNGLKRLGYTVETSGVPESRDDLMCTWNLKQGADERAAQAWEKRGGTVLVVENAYLQREDKSRYAISVHGHCGSGWFPTSVEDRFTELGFPLSCVWEPQGHILVCGQRSIGSSLMASPAGWGEKVTALLKGRHPDREVRFRRHPGNAPAKIPLERDLEGASRCMIWSSSAGVRALTMGVPVFYDAPHWIAAGAAAPMNKQMIVLPAPMETLVPTLNRVAHGQWSVDEIAQGIPFVRMRDQNWGVEKWA